MVSLGLSAFSGTKSDRRDGKLLLNLHEGIDDIRTVVVGNTHGGSLHLLHEPRKIVARAGDADDANCSALPQIALLKLRHRYVEAATQLIFQTAQDLALVFQGMRAFDAQFEGKNGDGHVEMLAHGGVAEARRKRGI